MIKIGTKVITLNGEVGDDDACNLTDDDGLEPHVAPGTIGEVTLIDNDYEFPHYFVVFPNGACVILYPDEINDPTQYEIVEEL